MTARRGSLTVLVFVVVVLGSVASSQGAESLRSLPKPRVAVMPLGDVGALRSEVTRLLEDSGLIVVAGGLGDAAARGVGYDGSLNPTKDEVRRLAAAIGCEILVLGASSVVERESSDPERRWDAFAGLFLVDGRTGNLVRYQGTQIFARDRDDAERKLRSAVGAEVASWPSRAAEAEAIRLEAPARTADATLLDFVTRPEGTAEDIPPRFFARPVPAYTSDADRVHASATVELLVEFRADGTYGRLDVVRWAGFGLTESAIEAVRAAKFWPARHRGVMRSARAMLRFNFRFRGDEPVSARLGTSNSTRPEHGSGEVSPVPGTAR